MVEWMAKENGGSLVRRGSCMVKKRSKRTIQHDNQGGVKQGSVVLGRGKWRYWPAFLVWVQREGVASGYGFVLESFFSRIILALPFSSQDNFFSNK
jgi:hypothetical protein